MKKYNITVNGTTYEVFVEEADASAAPTVVSQPAPMATPAPKAQAAAPKAVAGANSVTAPMPGTILQVKVTAGQAVKKGDVICVLEAMKMENDILAPADGVVASVEVSQGASVATDAVLVTMN